MAEVKIGCLCPGQPHPSDSVYLREKLDYRNAAAIKYAVLVYKSDEPDSDAGDVLAMLSEQYVLHGVEAWTLRDEKNKPLPVTREKIHGVLLADLDAATLVAEKADELYAQVVMLPLLRRGSTSSPPTPTNGSTSATNGSSRAPRKRSKPSSTSTSPMEDTVTISTSPAGVSSSSQS